MDWDTVQEITYKSGQINQINISTSHEFFTPNGGEKSGKSPAISVKSAVGEIVFFFGQIYPLPPGKDRWRPATPMWVFPKIRVPQNGWFIMENPIKIDYLGVPLFLETSIYWWKSWSRNRKKPPVHWGVASRDHQAWPPVLPREVGWGFEIVVVLLDDPPLKTTKNIGKMKSPLFLIGDMIYLQMGWFSQCHLSFQGCNRNMDPGRWSKLI